MFRWIRRRCREELADHPSAGQREASAALRNAEQGRRQVEATQLEVANTVRVMREARERNHFAEAIKIALRGSP